MKESQDIARADERLHEAQAELQASGGGARSRSLGAVSSDRRRHAG